MIYLASPYSDPDPAVMEARFHAVCKVAAKFYEQGLAVFSPIVNTHTIACSNNLPRDWQFWWPINEQYLEASKALVIAKLPGWELSQGIKKEFEKACAINIPVIHLDVP